MKKKVVSQGEYSRVCHELKIADDKRADIFPASKEDEALTLPSVQPSWRRAALKCFKYVTNYEKLPWCSTLPAQR